MMDEVNSFKDKGSKGKKEFGIEKERKIRAAEGRGGDWCRWGYRDRKEPCYEESCRPQCEEFGFYSWLNELSPNSLSRGYYTLIYILISHGHSSF